MADAANADALQAAFETHLEQTKEHVERLKEVFVLLGAPAKAKACKGMHGPVDEGNEVIAAAQKVEHSEIAAQHGHLPDKPDSRKWPNCCPERSRKKRYRTTC
jgi:ferritin-like metal-binding protein YciE